jgi:L-rhamnose mutarotase
VKRYGLTIALRDDPAAIERYVQEHREAWPEVVDQLRGVGIVDMRIFLTGRRLFMYYEARDDFDPDRDFAALNNSVEYRRWDELMRTLQTPAPEAQADEWWAPMEMVFDLGWF